MKQFCMMALAGLLVVGCQEVPKGYVINGEVENMPDGKIYLKSFRNKMFFDVDTAEIKDGKFTFKGGGRSAFTIRFGNREHELSGSTFLGEYGYECQDRE